jgi:GMP synthase (glutamine-hydrolysing)
MLARHLGARVFTYPDKRSEIGYYPVAPTPDADRLCAAPFPRCVYHWHCDGFELPRGARLLAGSDGAFPNQAFAFAQRALALQFHPEVTYAMICRWTTRGEERLDRPGAQPRSEHLEGWFRYDRAVAQWLETMLPVWLDGALVGAEARASRGWGSAPTFELGTGLAAASPR